MTHEQVCGVQREIAQQFLTCTPEEPVHTVGCCGPADAGEDDNRWMVKIYTSAAVESKSLDELRDVLKSLGALFKIIQAPKFSFLPLAKRVSRLPAVVGPETAIVPDQSGEFGTLGMIVSKNGTDRYLLTCNHVIADASGVFARDGTLLATEIEPAAGPSSVDAAIAKFRDGIAINPCFPTTFGRVQASPQYPTIGMSVEQAGAGSARLRVGRISCWPCDACVSDSDGNSKYFSNVAVVDSFATHGDSGSVAIDRQTGAPVGMLFACSSGSNDCSGEVLLAALPDVVRSFGVKPVVS